MKVSMISKARVMLAIFTVISAPIVLIAQSQIVAQTQTQPLVIGQWVEWRGSEGTNRIKLHNSQGNTTTFDKILFEHISSTVNDFYINGEVVSFNMGPSGKFFLVRDNNLSPNLIRIDTQDSADAAAVEYIFNAINSNKNGLNPHVFKATFS